MISGAFSIRQPQCLGKRASARPTSGADLMLGAPPIGRQTAGIDRACVETPARFHTNLFCSLFRGLRTLSISAPNEACEPRTKDHSRPLDRNCVTESPPSSISPTQPSEYRRVHLYGVSGNARVGALFIIVKLTTVFYDKHFADQFEYPLWPSSNRCVEGEVVARYSRNQRQFAERHLIAESALHKPQRLSNAFHIGSQRSMRATYQDHRRRLDRSCVKESGPTRPTARNAGRDLSCSHERASLDIDETSRRGLLGFDMRRRIEFVCYA
jgi:hypothetical protein